MDLTMVLEDRSGMPLYLQLYESFKQAIAAGNLPVGTKLPSVRQFASSHRISKMTVETAYQQLLVEGYIESRPRSGFYVMEVEEFGDASVNPPLVFAKREVASPAPVLYNFHGSRIDLSKFPMTAWRRCMVEAMDTYQDDLAFYGPPQGEYELRVEIANYLQHARTVRCTPEQIIVGSGLQQSISFLLLLMASDGQKMAWEDPGYSDARSVCNDHGWDVVPIPLEDDGINIDHLWQSEANAVLVTPAHQYPYGMVMPIGKRLKLLEWAKATGGIIIEEDYDGEFRYGIKPVPSLQGLDTHGSVAYIGNFSKAFSPAIRMNYLVLPPRLLQRYHEQNFRKYPSTVSRIEQRAMQLFMQKGHWTKHVRKMRQVYARKQQVLVDALHHHLGDRVAIMGQSAGLHLLIELVSEKPAAQLICDALANGVKVYPVEHGWLQQDERIPTGTRPRIPTGTHPRIQTGTHPRILLGFGGLSEKQIEEGVRILARTWL